MRSVWVLTFILLMVGCSDSYKPAYKQQLYVFGTMVEIAIWGEKPEKSQQAVEKIASEFDKMHRDWHAWEHGDLNDVNRAIHRGETVTVPPTVLPLLQKAITLNQASHGLFDPAVGRLVKLWGFSDSLLNLTQPPPEAEITATIAEKPRLSDLSLKGDQLSSSNPNVHLDFGGFAKGYAVDRAIEQLQGMGINNAIVNAGGDLRAIGRHGERPWRIGIRNPRGQGLIASIDVVDDESIFTSGDYERYFEYQGKRYHHIIDPRTGYPAQGLTSVTILGHDAATADAAATALFVAGPKAWPEIAKSMGLTHVMLIDKAGKIYITPQMRKRITFQVTPEPEVIVEDLS